MVTEEEVRNAMDQFKGRRVNEQLKRDIHKVLSDLIVPVPPRFDFDIKINKRNGNIDIEITQGTIEESGEWK